MIEMINAKARYFISASLAVVLTVLSLYYASQWEQDIDCEKDILERIWRLEERMWCSKEQIRHMEDRIWSIDERIQCIEGKYNQSAYDKPVYNQKGCSQEQAYSHEDNHCKHEISASQEDESSYQDRNQDYNKNYDSNNDQSSNKTR